MNLRSAAISIALCCVCLPVQAQKVSVAVTNPSSLPRLHEPVVLAWPEVGKKLGATPMLRIVDDRGLAVPFQIDDLDVDGVPDEIAFVADFDAGQRRVFTLAPTNIGENFPARTDAQDYKRIDGVLQSVDDDDVPGDGRERKAYRFDGVGWESEVVGYRLYLDDRNATDIQGKRIPGLYWKWIGESGVDYQLDAFWGMDVLHVGPALGIGGIGFWVGDSVLKPLTLHRQRSRIVARGPVRAIVRVEYIGWRVGPDTVDVTSQFSIYAGNRMTEHRVTLTKSRRPLTLATGIVKHDSTMVAWDARSGVLSTIGTQSRAGDTLLMAITVDPVRVIRKTADAFNEIILLTLKQNTPATILISSYWQGEKGPVWSRDQIKRFLRSTGLRRSEPLQIHFD
jgi:hypothetical protein